MASLRNSSFHRVLVVNGHGDNSAVGNLAQDLMTGLPEMAVRPCLVRCTKDGSHASWFEIFSWIRLTNVAMPTKEKLLVDYARVRAASPAKRAGCSATDALAVRIRSMTRTRWRSGM